MNLNLTMTKYPVFNRTSQEIVINFDGLFAKEGMAEAVTPRTTFASAIGQQQREQIWLHQSMLDSLVHSLKLERTM